MSNLLLEAVKRPLLHVKNELQRRYAWNSMVISLAAAPEVFSEARRLLHKWFLQTGEDRVLEVQIELVSAILDVLFRPSSWGIPLDGDFKFPSSYAFFCQRVQPLLTVLMGPISYGNLVTILNILEEMQSWEEFNSTAILSFSSNKKPCETSLLVDHNSAWALLLNFPTWFHFASILLFQQDTVEFSEAHLGTESHGSDQVHSNNVTRKVDKVRNSSFESFYNAAKYLAWVLSPLEASHRDLVVRSLVETAESWKPWRSKLICSEKKMRMEETSSQFNSLDWECEIKVNRKRSVSSLASEKGRLDVRHKKAKLEFFHEDPTQNDLHGQDTGDYGLEKSPQAVMMWLADFSRSCSELCIGPVMSDSLHINASIYRGNQNCEGWSEIQAVRTERKIGGLSQKAGADACVTQYAFLRRIALGLFLANVHLLNEYACHLLLHFVAAEECTVPTADSAAGTYHDIPKNRCADLQVGHASTSLYPGKSVEMTMRTEEPAHRTEGFRESTSGDCQGERKTNWVRVTTFILGFLEMLDFNYNVFENAKGCQISWSEVKGKTSKFLVNCIKMLLESRDLHESRLLIDLRSRLVEWTHNGETLCDKVTLCQDILPALDSQISLLQASR